MWKRRNCTPRIPQQGGGRRAEQFVAFQLCLAPLVPPFQKEAFPWLPEHKRKPSQTSWDSFSGMFPSPSLMCLSLLFVPLCAMLLLLLAPFHSSAPFVCCLLLFSHILCLLHILFPCSPPQKEKCLALSLSAAVSCCAGQTGLGPKPPVCSWENQAGDTTGKQLRTPCSASLERIFPVKKMKASTGPNTTASFCRRVQASAYSLASHFILSSYCPHLQRKNKPPRSRGSFLAFVLDKSLAPYCKFLLQNPPSCSSQLEIHVWMLQSTCLLWTEILKQDPLLPQFGAFLSSSDPPRRDLTLDLGLWYMPGLHIPPPEKHLWSTVGRIVVLRSTEQKQREQHVTPAWLPKMTVAGIDGRKRRFSITLLPQALVG